jgi:3-hydroxymyristoyl/3-hydroxydecanoyl-(acyl carrier protein) dehydratase
VQSAEVNDFLESAAWVAAQAHFNLPKLVSHVEKDEKQVFLLEVSPGLGIFEGHFPENPILPGIVQLHWAVGIATAVYSFQHTPFEIKRLKFKNIVQPPRTLELTLARSADNEIEFKFTSTGQVHSMGCFVIEEEPRC